MVSQVILIVYTTEVYAVEIGAAAETEVASASTILALICRRWHRAFLQVKEGLLKFSQSLSHHINAIDNVSICYLAWFIWLCLADFP